MIQNKSRLSLDPIIDPLRSAKHSAYVHWRKARLDAIYRFGNNWNSVLAKLRPFTYRKERYLDPRGFFPFEFFLDREAPSKHVSEALTVPKVLWCFWADETPMSERRKQSLAEMRVCNSELEVQLVTPKNLQDFILRDHPLHPSYEHLSAVHRSDYLRAYFLHHYGGAYHDIKPPGGSMVSAIDRLNREERLWIVGYQEGDFDLVAILRGPLGNDVRRNYKRISGIGGMASRPKSPFAAEWLAEIERRLDYYSSLLVRYPATGPLGNNPGYPITWIGIGAAVFQPLQLKYLDRVYVDPALRPAVRDYR